MTPGGRLLTHDKNQPHAELPFCFVSDPQNPTLTPINPTTQDSLGYLYVLRTATNAPMRQQFPM